MIKNHEKKGLTSSDGRSSRQISSSKSRTSKHGSSTNRQSSIRASVTRNGVSNYESSVQRESKSGRHSKSSSSGLPERKNQLMSHAKTDKKRGAIGRFRKDFKVSHDKKRIGADKHNESTYSTKRAETIQPQKFKRATKIMEKLKKYKRTNLLMNEIQEIMRMGPFAAQILCQICVKCNALTSSKQCICSANICINNKLIGKPTICFCANSYVRGKDGFVYHSMCNCCGDH